MCSWRSTAERRFEPRLRAESFHAGWDFGILSDLGAVALAPASVATGLPESTVALAVSDASDTLETSLVSRSDSRSPAVAACSAAAHALFAR
jgi:hypothetical protein